MNNRGLLRTDNESNSIRIQNLGIQNLGTQNLGTQNLRIQNVVASPAKTKRQRKTLSAQSLPQPDLSEIPVLPPTEGEPIRHILLGTPGGVRQTIHLLHMLRYVENALWSPLVPIPNDQLIITPRQGDVMSILVRHLS